MNVKHEKQATNDAPFVGLSGIGQFMLLKGAYETGNVYKQNGAYEEGLYRKTWNVQTCAEFYPMENSELQIYLHLLYKKHVLTERARMLGATSSSTQRVSLGLVYTIPVF